MMVDPHLATHLYFDRHFHCMAARVLPGEYYVTGQEMGMLTVLGSCVSACIRDRQSGIGGMNHFMLPDGGDATGPASASMRYGEAAMEILLSQLLKAGAQRARLEAKVFGGGRVLSGLDALNVGERNAAFVREFLLCEKIAIVAEDLNDVHPRKLAYFPRTGRALVRKLAVTDGQLIEMERAYASQLSQRPLTGEVALS